MAIRPPIQPLYRRSTAAEVDAQLLQDLGSRRPGINDRQLVNLVCLLGATIECLRRRGYAHTTVGDIIQRASVSRRAFYEMFVNKADCYDWICAALETGHP